jgi:heat shock protein HtpX
MALAATGLRTWQWNSFVRSALLLAGFPVLLVVLVFAVVALFMADSAPDFTTGVQRSVAVLPQATGFALVASAVWFTIAWFAHQKIIDLVTGAKRTTREAEPRLWNLLENLCISRGFTMPSLRIIETPARNAFASGLTRERYAVTVTRGLIDALDDAELEAVLAHELTHIRNGDARLAVIAAVFAGILSLIPEVVMRSFRVRRAGRIAGRSSSSSSSRRGGGSPALAIVAVVLILLVWALAVALRFALSRNREFLADAGAVELTKNPDAMITALRKVERHSDLPEVPDQVRAMFLDDQKNAKGGSLWATHPSMQSRIEALVRYAGGRDPGPIPEAPPVLVPVLVPALAPDEAPTVVPGRAIPDVARSPHDPWGAPPR